MVEINQSFEANQSQTNQNQAFNQAQNQANPKGLFQIPDKFLQLIPWIPIGLEMLTGQKIPPTGVLADILSGVQQVQFSLNQVLANQQKLWSKLESLETNASSQLTNLNQQVQTFKLLATETKKSLEFSQPKPQVEYE